MEPLYLIRESISDEGTFGKLVYTLAGVTYIYCTAELPWRGNIRNVSCIPSGVYECVLDDFRGIPSFKVLNVPNRSDVEIHYGNWSGDISKGYVTDVEGCILLGKSHVRMKPDEKETSQMAVTYSKDTMKEVGALFPHKFNLHIIDLTKG